MSLGAIFIVNNDGKKRKCDNDIFNNIVQVVEIKNNNWLVEWEDKTRTWENYEELKHTDAFKNYIVKAVNKAIYVDKSKKCPEYIG